MPGATRDLLAELKAPRERRDASEIAGSFCALEQRLVCCDGAGLRTDLSGPVVLARACTCLKSCPSCYGGAQQVKDGIARPCRTPNPVRIINSLNSATIPSRYGSASLDGFSNYTGNGREVVGMLKEWLKSYDPKTSKGIIIGGPTGVGKTHLLCAIAMTLASRGQSVRFVDFFQLLSELRAGYTENKSDEEILRPLINVDLLIIDELGKGRHNDFELAVIDQLVMGRYNQRKPLLASTNYSLKAERKGNTYSFEGEGRRGFNLDEFETLEARIGKRTFSRLSEMSRILELSGNDYRRMG